MTNDYYNATSVPTRYTLGQASDVATPLAGVAAGFELLPAKLPMWQNRVNYATGAGAADVYTATLTNCAAYVEGLMFAMSVSATNTGACTINVNSIGAVSLKRVDGSNPEAGDLTVGDIVQVLYDGTNFIMMTQSRVSLAAMASNLAADLAFTGDNTFAGTTALNGVTTVAAGVTMSGTPTISGAAVTSGAWNATGLMTYELVAKFTRGTTTTQYVGIFGGDADGGMISYDSSSGKPLQLKNLSRDSGELFKLRRADGTVVMTIDEEGTALDATTTAVTREKGDARWGDLSGSRVLIESQTASADATIEFTAFDNASVYNRYYMEIDSLVAATDGEALRVRISLDDGSTWKASGSGYHWRQAGGSNTTAGYMELGDNQADGSGNTGGMITMTMLLTSGSRSMFWSESLGNSSLDVLQVSARAGSGVLYTGQVNGLQFYMGAGNITSGEFRLYGQVI